jgi:outer membrane protein assembly factor BamE
MNLVSVMFTRILFFIFIVSALGACSSEGTRKIPGVYRIDMQQGNVIEQEMLDKLRPGMEKSQVHFIMGTPTIVDPFHNDRWEYIYTYSKGGKRRTQRHITIFFEDDKLTYLDGSVVKGVRKPPEEYRKERKTVDVPLKRKKDGFFSKLKNVLPFVGDDEPKRHTPKPAKEETAQVEDATPPEVENENSETTP